MEEAFKKFLYAGVDLVAEASEKFQKSVTDLVEKGTISSTEGKKLVDEFLEKTEDRKEQFEEKFSEVKEKLGIVKKTAEDELESLRTKVADLEAKMKAEIGADHRAESASSGQFGPVRVKSNQFEPARIDRTTSFDSTGIGVGIFTSAVTCFCARSMALLGTAFRGYGAVEWGRRMGVATNVGTNDTYPYNGAGRGERAKQRSHIASATTVLAQRPVCVWMRMRMCPKHQGPIPWDHGQIKLGSRAASRITFRCR